MAVTGLYSGSFDPLTNGHMDVIRRAAALVDRLVIAVGIHHGKTPFFDAEARVALIEQVAFPEIRQAGAAPQVITFDGLVVDAAREASAKVIIRGLRDTTDFDYETQMAGMNATMAPDVETMFLAASPEVRFIASSLVKQIAGMGGDISPFVPDAVADAISRKIGS